MVNFRPLCFWGLFVAVTVVLVFVHLWAALGWIIFLAVALGGLWIFKKNCNFSRSVFIVTALVLCSAALVSFTVTTRLYADSPLFHGEGTVQGLIRSMTLRQDDVGRVSEGSITLVSATFNGEQVSGRVFLRLRNMDDGCMANLRVGNIISVQTRIRPANANLAPDDASSFSVNNRVRYTGNVTRRQISFVRESGDVRSSAMRHTNNFLHRFMTASGAELLYSMIFGDRSSLDPDMRESFSATGLAHALAVSGMHIGVVIALLILLLKLLRVNNKWQFILTVIFLAFYIYLADFRYPILRASIMFTIFLANKLFSRRGDFLSSISLAGIVILILFPYAIQSLSFKMSFACVLGIALFRRPLTQFFDRKLPFRDRKRLRGFRKAVVEILALDIGTSITVFPILLVYFSQYSLVGIASNIFFLPFIILAFKLGVFALVTVVGFPLLFVADFLLHYTLIAIQWTANLGMMVRLSAPNGWFLFYFLALIFLSRYVNWGRKYKYTAAALCFAAYVGTILLWNL